MLIAHCLGCCRFSSLVVLLLVAAAQEGLNFSVLREIKVLKELKHVHLLELLDVSVTPDGLELVLDLCETDLKRVIEDRKHVAAIRLEDAKARHKHRPPMRVEALLTG